MEYQIHSSDNNVGRHSPYLAQAQGNRWIPQVYSALGGWGDDEHTSCLQNAATYFNLDALKLSTDHYEIFVPGALVESATAVEFHENIGDTAKLLNELNKLPYWKQFLDFSIDALTELTAEGIRDQYRQVIANDLSRAKQAVGPLAEKRTEREHNCHDSYLRRCR